MNSTKPPRWWRESIELREDNASGAHVRQLTSAPAITHDLYHEQPPCSAEGNRLALFRTAFGDPTAPGDLMVYEIEQRRITCLARDIYGIGSGIHALATSSWSGHIYAVQQREKDRVLLHVNLNTLESTELFEWDDTLGFGPKTVSPDGRRGLAIGRPSPETLGIFRFELRSGHGDWIHISPHLSNPHLQYRLHADQRILIQENRGEVLDEVGNIIRPYDERGVGLYSISSEGDDRRDFPVGPPWTAGTTGHECWIGDSDRVLVTLVAPYNDGERCGNIVEARVDWEKPRVVFDSPRIWNHISVSRCGKYFVADIHEEADIPIIIGSIASGKTRVLCNAQTSAGYPQYTHSHPYLTSDNRHVVFNSDRTGLAQAYCASVPEDFLQSLDE
jgi:hypothetical protein